MEAIVKKALLFDFYGELLTEHQKNIYSEFISDDIGISEIAQERGVSRQGIHDLLKRCDRILEEYEEKLHLVEKFLKAKEQNTKINQLTVEFETTKDVLAIEEIQRLSNQVLEEF